MTPLQITVILAGSLIGIRIAKVLYAVIYGGNR